MAFDFWNFYAGNRSNMNLYNSARSWLKRDVQPYFEDMFGYTQKKNAQESAQAQIDYENYLKAGNERAIADFYKNEPGHTIRYPELSYPGQIYRANTAIARAGFDYANADANFYGNLPYRTAGLYGITSKLSRYL